MDTTQVRISFSLKNAAKKEGRHVVMFNFFNRVTKERVRISSDVAVRKTQWDSRAKRPKNDLVYEKLITEVAVMRSQLEKFSSIKLFHQWRKRPYPVQGEVTDFYAFGEWFASREQKFSTALSYRTGLNSFKRVYPRLSVEAITYGMVRNYIDKLNDEGLRNNTIRAYIAALSKIYREACDRKDIPNINPFRNPPGKSRTKHRNIPTKEIKKVLTATSDDATLQLSLDLNLLSFLLRGLDIIDIVRLKDENYEDGYIVAGRRKNSKRVLTLPMVIKVFPETDRLMNKYPGKDGYLFNFCPVDLDSREGYLKYANFLRRHNARLSHFRLKYNLSRALTSKAIRHSFGTIAHEVHESMEKVGILLGHSSGNGSTHFYVDSKPQEIVDGWHEKTIKEVLE